MVTFNPISIISATKTINDKAVELSVHALDNQAHDKPVLVFIHGIGACKETFTETGTLQAFCDTHRVVALDLPGHGQSTMIDKLPNLTAEERDALASEFYSLPGLIAQIATALKALNVSQAAIFGWSIGGHITHGLAIKYPELVRATITTGTPVVNYADPNDLKKGFSEWFCEKIIPDWISNPQHYSRADSEKIISSMGYAECKEGGRDQYVVDSLMESDPLFRKFLYSTLAEHADKPELYGRNFLERFSKIPVCFIEGEDDAGCNVKNLQEQFITSIKPKHPTSKLYSFEKTGHAVFRARTEEFIAALKIFEQNHAINVDTTISEINNELVQLELKRGSSISAGVAEIRLEQLQRVAQKICKVLSITNLTPEQSTAIKKSERKMSAIHHIVLKNSYVGMASDMVRDLKGYDY